MNDHHSKTIEDWATEKGMLPKMTKIPARVGRHAGTAERLNPTYHLFAQAKTLRAWPEGKEVSEDEFDSAVREGNSIPLT
jgi:hypothetical protein